MYIGDPYAEYPMSDNVSYPDCSILDESPFDTPCIINSGLFCFINSIKSEGF